MLLPFLTIGLSIRAQGQDWQQQMQTDANYVPYTTPNEPVEDPRLSDNSTLPQLQDMNESASSIHFEDRQHGPFNAGVELKGAWTDNFYNQTVDKSSGHYFQIGVPFGLDLRRPKTAFALSARLDTAFYPDVSMEILSSYSLFTTLHHENTEKTSWDWSLAGGRFSLPNQTLPAVIDVGSTGIAQPLGTGKVGQGNYLTSNFASSLGITHFLTEHDSITATVTAGWTESSLDLSFQGTLRDQVGGTTVQWSHILNPSSSIAFQANAVYVRGLEPKDHGSFTAVEASYKRTFKQHLSYSVGAGPLFTNVSGGDAPSANALNYTAHADAAYATRSSRYSGGYSRVIALGYGTQPSEANQFMANVDRRLTRNGDLTLGTRYIGATSQTPGLSQSSFGLSARYDLRLNGHCNLFVGGTRTQQVVPNISSPTTSTSYGRNEFTTGLTVTLATQANSPGDR